MSYFERAIAALAESKSVSVESLKEEAFEAYARVNRTDLGLAIRRYATDHKITTPTAIAEACRAFFLGE